VSGNAYPRPEGSTHKKRVLAFFCAFVVALLLFIWLLLPKFAVSAIEKSFEAAFEDCQAHLKSKDGFLATVGGTAQNAELNLKFAEGAPVSQISAVYADRAELWTTFKAGEASLSQNAPDKLCYQWDAAALTVFLQQRQSFMSKPVASIGKDNINISCTLSVYGRDLQAELLVIPQIEEDKLLLVLQKVSTRTIDGQPLDLSTAVEAKLADKLQMELAFPPLNWPTEGAEAYLDNGFLLVSK